MAENESLLGAKLSLNQRKKEEDHLVSAKRLNQGYVWEDMGKSGKRWVTSKAVVPSEVQNVL